jgi:GntR family transcriptional regulator, sialic acid-inducible nan operon repressor
MQPIRHKKLSDEVTDRLIEAIMSGRYQPGAQLPSERELMAMLDVGRPVVRESMQKLAQMGLLRISHGERARIVSPSPDDIMRQASSAMVMLLSSSPDGLRDLKEARLMMETGLVRIAAERASADQIRHLRSVHGELIAARGDAERFVAADANFHGAIVDISGNQLFGAVLRGLLAWMVNFKREMVQVRGADALTISEHERIMEAIARSDADGAAKAMSDHLLRANELYSTFA